MHGSSPLVSSVSSYIERTEPFVWRVHLSFSRMTLPPWPLATAYLSFHEKRGCGSHEWQLRRAGHGVASLHTCRKFLFCFLLESGPRPKLSHRRRVPWHDAAQSSPRRTTTNSDWRISVSIYSQHGCCRTLTLWLQCMALAHPIDWLVSSALPQWLQEDTWFEKKKKEMAFGLFIHAPLDTINLKIDTARYSSREERNANETIKPMESIDSTTKTELRKRRMDETVWRFFFLATFRWWHQEFTIVSPRRKKIWHIHRSSADVNNLLLFENKVPDKSLAIPPPALQPPPSNRPLQLNCLLPSVYHQMHL